MTQSVQTTTAITFAVAIATAALLAFAAPTSAFWGGHGEGHNFNRGDDNDIRVSNTNTANVSNTVNVHANTGRNDANGGRGGNGGNGGNAKGDGDNTGGNGGNAGDGALGGYIQTGTAAAVASLYNEVNVNNTRVNDSCGCDNRGDYPMYQEARGPWFFWGRRHGDDNDIRVVNDSTATVRNGVDVGANTGSNVADGGGAGNGGNGGNAVNNEHHYKPRPDRPHFFWWWDGEDDDTNTGGRGGNGGNGGVGGSVFTGEATSGAEVTNVVNRNVTRVTRGGLSI